jgi:hypothetical protein
MNVGKFTFIDRTFGELGYSNFMFEWDIQVLKGKKSVENGAAERVE